MGFPDPAVSTGFVHQLLSALPNFVDAAADLLARLSLTDIGKVTFYKRDEITTDLVCCDVSVGEKVWTFHEELVGWEMLIDHQQGLPSIRSDWFAAVSQPPCATLTMVAFSRQ